MKGLVLIAFIHIIVVLKAQSFSDSLGNRITFLNENRVEYCFNYAGGLDCFNYAGGLGPYRLCGCSDYRIKGRKLIIISPHKEKHNCDLMKFTESSARIEPSENYVAEIRVVTETNEPITDAMLYLYNYKTKEHTYLHDVWDDSNVLKIGPDKFPENSLLFVDCWGCQDAVIPLARINNLRITVTLVKGVTSFFKDGRFKMMIINRQDEFISLRFFYKSDVYYLYREK